ncbi:MAG: carboxymuconolactone decarboxylase family protein [Phycisphaerae bacterium]
MEKSSLNAWELLVNEQGSLAEAISGSIEKIFNLAKLDEKTKQLIYIAVQTAMNYPLAVKYHIPLALQAGATRDEIVGASSIAATAAGPKGFVSCFPMIIEQTKELDQETPTQ